MTDKRHIDIKVKGDLSIIPNIKDNAGWRGAGGTVKIKETLLGGRAVWSQVIEQTAKSAPQEGTFISLIEAAPAKANPAPAAGTAINAAAADAVAEVLSVKQAAHDGAGLIMVDDHLGQILAADTDCPNHSIF